MHWSTPLSPKEIRQAADLVQSVVGTEQIYFRVITLKEPTRQGIAKLPSECFNRSNSLVPREAEVLCYLNQRHSSDFWKFVVDLNKESITTKDKLEGRHSHVDAEDFERFEEACMKDERVKKAIAAMTLPDEAVIMVEPWTYATDGIYDMKDKITMCYFYMRLVEHEDANYYAHPLSICAEVSGDYEVLNVLDLPLDDDATNFSTRVFDPKTVDSTSEYHPDLTQAFRSTTTPYHVSQPKGPSFSVTEDNFLEWEKWTMVIGFNYREGMTLHDIKYDGRSVFHRLSLSEMFVPYGDSRMPYGRKAAFDLGNDGAGVNANNLQLGCDCLGHIKYFDGYHVTKDGDPLKLPNVICCHEVDDGILWKHTNFRTQNPVVARSRVLILQSIVTVSNYEYIFAFHFSQDASVHYEVRATGILSTVPMPIEGKSKFGTRVAPGVLAPYHQHLFCLRIDPAIDGNSNSLIVEETHPISMDDPAMHNPSGIGFTTVATPVEHECGLDLAPTLNRNFKIVNEDIINPITLTSVGYKLIPHPSQMLLAHPSSYHAKRSEFAAHAVWVTRYHEDELFAAGQFTMQSLGGEGIASWIRARQQAAEGEVSQGNADATSVRKQDIVIWHTFGSTHIPRVEDWPVMPCEKLTVGLKPVNFFQRNPGMDVRPASQTENQSVLVNGSAGDGSCAECPST